MLLDDGSNWGVGDRQAGAERAGWLETASVTGVVAEKAHCSSSLFSGNRRTQNGVGNPQSLIAMETWVVSKATSKATLPVACLGCSYTS